ncbi:tyrosine-type recombinase/integrase [Streptomyces sp. NPDC088794]|uniref:tyrosine-type recombinase/integrase n=1 Tax=Streptomyces sp. NPDC088794 TaxID=3365902 RepID=UPI00380E3D65
MPDPVKEVRLASGKIRYRFVVDVGRHPNGDRRQLTVTRESETEARAEYGRIIAQKENGTLVLPSNITVAQWIDEWLKMKERDVELTSIITYRNTLVHIVDRLGGTKLQDLTTDQVRDCVDDIVARGRRSRGPKGTRLAASTAEYALNRFREVLSSAVVCRLRTTNPAQGVRVSLADKKADRRLRPKVKPWSVSEVQFFIAGIENDRLEAPLLMSLMGLRPAEVVGLQWEYLDLPLATLEIVITRPMVGNETVEKDPKTEAGERVLPLPGPVGSALKRLKLAQAREKLAAGEAYADTGWVVVDELGLPLSTKQLRRYVYRVMERLGMRKVRLYDARHSCLSYLANNGVPDHILAAWAGHTNAAFTKKKYVHVDVEDMREAAEKWGDFHGGAR